ncbi:TonB-dependent receptor [Sulfurimonas sp. HSL3-7]|uniref:TonB-dependent receptor n=1 Tax=Sulfonitrofixus jiaomeiensis TaxID=3131938 RepID=UPI0031F72377
MKARYFSFMLLACSTVLLQAEESLKEFSSTNIPHLASVTQQIGRDLEHFTEAATETKANEPYQPYIISVLDGKRLEKLGISTLGEALELIPGVDIATDLMDMKTPIFRGSNPLAFGQVKLLIDGILANDTFIDGFASYHYMPIEVIKRIEVVRGPGSKTDGINAYAGSIQVITYAEEIGEPLNRVFAKTGSYNALAVGFTSSATEGKLRIHADGYYQKDKKTLYAGPDAAATGIYNYQTPFYTIDNTALAQSGDAPLQTTTYALGLQLDYDAFSFKARGNSYTHGSAYGLNGLLPQDDDRIEMPAYLLELGWDKHFGDLEAVIKIGAKYDSLSGDARSVPAGFELPSLSDPLHEKVTFTDGFYGIHQADQRSFYQSAYLKYSGVDNHQITIGYRLSREETYNIVTITTDRDTGIGLVDYTDTLPFFDIDAKRDTAMFSLQDQMEIGTKLGILYGINIEKTSLSKIQYDPRISFVYQSDMQRIFKAIYSHSHRNPSWQELYTLNNAARVGNTDLKPETVDAFELAFIQKFSGSSYLQADVFYLINKDQIDKNNALHLYLNNHNTDIYGFELETSTQILPHDQLYASYSYVDGSDDQGNPLANVAQHLAKASYLYKFSPELSAGTVLKYVGSKSRIEGDQRDDTPSYFTADLSAHYQNPARQFNVTASVKNLADADVVYPSEPNTYTNDYPQDGRTFLLTLSKEF